MWNFDFSLLLVDLLFYGTATAFIVAAFRVLNYADGQRRRPLPKANWYCLTPSKSGRPVHLAHLPLAAQSVEETVTSAA